MEISPHSELISKNISKLAVDVVALDILMSIDQILNDIGVYTYANWIDGELVDGPHISRHWVESTWMWPKKKMPNPDGAMRLYKKGVIVTYEKDQFLKVVKVTDPNDIKNQTTKKAKESTHDVWCVTLKIPRKMVDDNVFDVIDPEKIILDQEINADVFDDEDDQGTQE